MSKLYFDATFSSLRYVATEMRLTLKVHPIFLRITLWIAMEIMHFHIAKTC